MPTHDGHKHTVAFETREEKDTFQNLLWLLKNKTGKNFGNIAIDALNNYQVKLQDKK